MTYRRGAAVRDVVLIVVAVGVLVLAGLLYVWLSAGDAPPDDEFVGFRCDACGHYFELSHRQFEQVWDRQEFRRGTGARDLLFKCQQCGQFTARRADSPEEPAPAPGEE